MSDGLGSPGEVSPELIAILLVTRSKPGPKLVFHYPPHPQFQVGDQTRNKPAEDSSDQDSDSDKSGDKSPPTKTGTSHPKEHYAESTGSSSNPNDREASVALDTVLGYSKDTLEKLLAPGRWCDRKKFEICLDGLSFTGHPIFADQDGNWARDLSEELPKPNADLNADANAEALENQSPEETSPPPHEEFTGQADTGEGPVNITVTSPRTPHIPSESFDHGGDSFNSQGATSLATSMQSNSTTSANVAEQLTMFHVVFVCKTSGSPLPVAELNRYVTKKLSKALQYCQKQTGYVAAECRKILALRTKARQGSLSATALWAQMCEDSELAWALQNIFENLSENKIAGFKLSGLEMSLQLPRDDSLDYTGALLGVHSGLLLLEDKIALLRNLTHPDASPLATFVRGHTPTKSLEKLARNLGMPITNVMYMARHLVKWRKARLIAPLHARNFYIVAPDAPLHDLARHTASYARQFSALPSLPQMLNSLSVRPIKYGSLIPSRDHRSAYMEILAYLVQYQFVVQLRTFGWLRTPQDAAGGHGISVVNQNRLPMSVSQLLSPQLRPKDDDNISVSSERTAIPLSLNDLTRVTSNDDPPPSHTDADGRDMGPKRIISNPLQQSHEDAQALAFIRSSIEDDDLRDRFDSLLPYLDGEHPFEEIAALEGVKRSKIDTSLDSLQRDGVLELFQHV